MALPAVRRTADQVNRTKFGRQTVGDVAAILPQQLAKITRVEDGDDLAMLDVDEFYAEETGRTEQDTAQARKVGKQIAIVRRPILQAMHGRQMFIAADILDTLIFDAARAGSTDLVLDVLTRIRDARALRPGMLVFPVHSLGVLAAGLLQAARKRIAFFDTNAGLAISPQTNSMTRTLQFLEEARNALGVKQAVPRDLVEHWRRSRPTKWLDHNPLLIVRARHLPGANYYTNECLLLSRLQAASAQVALLAALQPRGHERVSTLFSSTRMNNWETLDIHHYITMWDTGGQGKIMSGDCVPIHAGRGNVSDLTALPLDLDPRYWMRYSTAHARVREAVETVYGGHLKWLTRAAAENARTRTYRRLFTALTYFRRSLLASPDDFGALVALSTAFELMLTDSSGGVTAALTRNAGILLKGTRGVRALVAAVGEVYEARCSLVHAGKPVDAPLATARRAFALSYVALSKRTGLVTPTSPTPIGDMLGS